MSTLSNIINRLSSIVGYDFARLAGWMTGDFAPLYPAISAISFEGQHYNEGMFLLAKLSAVLLVGPIDHSSYQHEKAAENERRE